MICLQCQQERNSVTVVFLLVVRTLTFSLSCSLRHRNVKTYFPLVLFYENVIFYCEISFLEIHIIFDQYFS